MRFEIKGESVFATTGGRDFDPAKPVLIFLHGAGFDQSVWNQQSRYFAHRNHSVLAVDFPGNGRSTGKAPAEIGELADWVPHLMDALGVEEARLVGHSMGALVALECAVRYPKRISGISLMGAAAEMPVHPELLNAAKNNQPLAYDLVCSWGLGIRGHIGGAPVPGMNLMGGGLSLMASGQKEALAAGLEACNEYSSGKESAPKVSCSSLIVIGTEDRMSPAFKGRELASLIPDCKQEILPGCGHMMMLEDSKSSLEALKINL